MTSVRKDYEAFLDEASWLYDIRDNQTDYLMKMLVAARDFGLKDSDDNYVTLGWVAGFLAYFDLFPSVEFKPDSLADLHQLHGWDDADNFCR